MSEGAGVSNLGALLSLLSSWATRSRGVVFPGQAPLTLSVNWLGDKYSRCSHAPCALSSQLVGEGGGTLLLPGSSALICHGRLSQVCFLLRVLLAPILALLHRTL